MCLARTFEVVFKTEAVADDLQGAITEAKRKIADGPADGAAVSYGVIRDDNLFEGRRDGVSRHTNHVAVLAPPERQELHNILYRLGTSAPLPEAERFRLLERALKILD